MTQSNSTNGTMTQLLRQSLAQASSARSVARATGLTHGSLLRFLHGQRSLRLDLAERLAEHFGIESHYTNQTPNPKEVKHGEHR